MRGVLCNAFDGIKALTIGEAEEHDNCWRRFGSTSPNRRNRFAAPAYSRFWPVATDHHVRSHGRYGGLRRHAVDPV